MGFRTVLQSKMPKIQKQRSGNPKSPFILKHPKALNTALHWFRNDLRVEDNASLSAACQSKRVVAVYCLDPRNFENDEYGFPRTGKFRARFLLETLSELKESLRSLNIPLFISLDLPENAIPKLVRRFGVAEIHTQKEWTRDERLVARALLKALPENTKVFGHYNQFLFHPRDIPFSDFAQIPEVFTRFRKACEKTVPVRACLPVPEKRSAPVGVEPEVEIPTLQQLGLESPQNDPRSAFPFHGGTREGLQRIKSYFWEQNRLRYYKKTRNGLLGTDYSSKFSPWLANGSLSARMIYHQVRLYEKEVVKNQDTYWMIFELIWRDYFKYVSLKHGDLIFHPGGIRHSSWNKDFSPTLLGQWVSGRTPDDFINANMKEIAQTGWMSNRGRQNVASYWTHHLKQDWRVGAAYFESVLLDYDVHSNWGNWMYNSGVGNDPRDRVFNPQLQAKRYDPQGRYRRLWLEPSLF